MKLRLLLMSFLGSVMIANAQFTVKDADGNVINDGDIIEFGTTEYPAAEFEFFVTNDSSENIFSRVEYLSHTNASVPQFNQLCYGIECYWGIELGATVPPENLDAVVIFPDETTGMGNHFYSDDSGENPGENVDFEFAFKLYDGVDSTTEVGTPLYFTYRYNPTLSVNDVKQVNLSLVSTVVTERIVMDVNEPVQVQLYDYQGRLIKQASFETGRQEMNVSSLSSQAYILKFKNEQGATKTSKIVIR